MVGAGDAALVRTARRRFPDVRTGVRCSRGRQAGRGRRARAGCGRHRTVADRARLGAQDSHPLVRLAAVQAAEALPVPERAAVAAPLLGDPLRAVRIEAARVLAPAVPGSASLVRDPAWTRAAAEFVATQNYNADRPEARVALGSFDAALGR